MAKTKQIPNVESLSGYFFMAVEGTEVNVIYHDTADNALALGAAFASALQENDKLYEILSVAMLTAIEDRDGVKLTKKKPNPKQANRKGFTEAKPFVKTKKKAK